MIGAAGPLTGHEHAAHARLLLRQAEANLLQLGRELTADQLVSSAHAAAAIAQGHAALAALEHALASQAYDQRRYGDGR